MKEELRSLLIDHYEECISIVRQQENSLMAYSICREYSTHFGFCYCARMVFGYEDISIDFYIYKTPSSVIYSMPLFVKFSEKESFEKIIECLQFRVNYLKNLICEKN